MNVTEYTYLLNNPNAINERQAKALELALANFPYFQSARALHLKGLYNQDSYNYNLALKYTAAHTADRSVLFDFITSNEFTIIEKDIYERKLAELQDIIVTDCEHVLDSSSRSEALDTEKIDKKTVAATPATLTTTTLEGKLELGKPIAFSAKEKHSFEEWLQITKLQPIDRQHAQQDRETPTAESNPFSDSKKKKNELIDKFIESNPKITPVKNSVEKTSVLPEPNDNSAQLMTETLARVYLEQKKYPKAIQAYEILILKYPEKSSFFADRIKDIKILQQNNP